MGAQTIPDTGWMEFPQEDSSNRNQEAEIILQKLTDTFAQANIAADFLLLNEEPDVANPDLQLICLVKERIATIQEQVSELYQALNREHTSFPILKQ